MRHAVLAILFSTLLATPVFAAPGGKALDDMRILSADDMEGRLVGSAGGARARAYIAGRFAEIGLPSTEQSFDFRTRTGEARRGVNLIALIPGREKSGKVVVITAHYDHLGVRDGHVYNGADDNASGVAGVLAVAEEFKAAAPKHTVYFVLVDAEESGLRGARAFVAAPPVPLTDIGLNINIDMLAKNAKGELYASGGSVDPWIKGQLEALVPAVPVTLKLGHDTDADGKDNNWTYQSDQGAFAEKGVRWVYFGVEDHPEYHKPTDDFATVPQDFFLRSVQTVVLAARRFDDQLDTMPERAK